MHITLLRGLLLCALGLPFGAMAQVDLPVFGKQHVINGYAKDVEGEVLSYFSVYPEHATTALLTRCTDGTKAIAWETAAVPFSEQESVPYYYFSWIAAHNSTTSGGDRSFDLYINDEKALTFTTHHNTKPGSWSAAGADSLPTGQAGTKLVFEFSKADRHGDAHGFAHLRVPRKYITPGQPVKLKVVGHAQDSPDWFMTFRYSFEEKVELEVLPFLSNELEYVTRPLQLTVMHFGGPEKLIVDVGEQNEGHTFDVRNGLQVFDVLLGELAEAYNIRVQVRLQKDPSAIHVDTLVHIEPVIHRNVYLVHHSHTDIGYSHLQAEVETIQNNNIFKALALIDRTKDYPEGSRFVWNVESLWAVENFLGITSEADKQRFIAAVKAGHIALSANYANLMTGLCTPEEMHWIVEYADSLRAWYDLPITMAMQTDVPGMSWSMVDAYAAHGIRYLSQGPNYIPDMPDGGDRIGSTLREQGDKPYWWKSTTGKDSILVWTAGQGYGGWHGYTAGAIEERGTRKIAAYMNVLAANGYPYDMVQWRYNIVSDNGPVDSTLSDFVRDWNEKYISPRLIIANAGTMIGEFETKYGKDIPTWSGDFTPYWEDGAYSTAKEEGDVRILSARLSNLIEAAKILKKPIDPHLLYRAKRSIVMWHEHTWGAWCSISDPDAHFTKDQWRVKQDFADSAGWYVEAVDDWLFTPPALDWDTIAVLNTLPWTRYRHDIPEHGVTERESSSTPLDFIDVNDIYPTALVEAIDKQLAMNGIDPSSVGCFAYDRQQKDNSPRTRRRDSKINGDPSRTLELGDLNWDDHESAFEMFSLLHSVGTGDSMRLVVADIDRFPDSLTIRIFQNDSTVHVRYSLHMYSERQKESYHSALPFNIPNATVRIGISDTCVTPESGRIPGSNNDFFCAQRWIDVSNDSMGVTIVCPQGALWEVGDMVDERKVNPGKGTNPEYYKAWKTEAKSSSTLYLYALNNYWHTNFKADQEGPITFDIYLKMHGPFKLEDARRFGLEMTRPLITWWK